MTVIADLLDRDPRAEKLVNNGQARLAGSEAEAREELKTFVCEGRFAEGIAKVLESFCRDLENTSQQAAWVSGFYGSGKSHLLKMVDYLWRNAPFPDGLTPRTLVADLPENVRAALKELDGQAARAGGLFAAAGPMPSGQLERPRHSVLAIVLRAAGLPADFGKAAFWLWLEDKNLLNSVAAAVMAQGGMLETEIEELLYQSGHSGGHQEPVSRRGVEGDSRAHPNAIPYPGYRYRPDSVRLDVEAGLQASGEGRQGALNAHLT